MLQPLSESMYASYAHIQKYWEHPEKLPELIYPSSYKYISSSNCADLGQFWIIEAGHVETALVRYAVSASIEVTSKYFQQVQVDYLSSCQISPAAGALEFQFEKPGQFLKLQLDFRKPMYRMKDGTWILQACVYENTEYTLQLLTETISLTRKCNLTRDFEVVIQFQHEMFKSIRILLDELHHTPDKRAVLLPFTSQLLKTQLISRLYLPRQFGCVNSTLNPAYFVLTIPSFLKVAIRTHMLDVSMSDV